MERTNYLYVRIDIIRKVIDSCEKAADIVKDKEIKRGLINSANKLTQEILSVG